LISHFFFYLEHVVAHSNVRYFSTNIKIVPQNLLERNILKALIFLTVSSRLKFFKHPAEIR